MSPTYSISCVISLKIIHHIISMDMKKEHMKRDTKAKTSTQKWVIILEHTSMKITSLHFR
jgi:hypothetical protein